MHRSEISIILATYSGRPPVRTVHVIKGRCAAGQHVVVTLDELFLRYTKGKRAEHDGEKQDRERAASDNLSPQGRCSNESAEHLPREVLTFPWTQTKAFGERIGGTLHRGVNSRTDTFPAHRTRANSRQRLQAQNGCHPLVKPTAERVGPNSTV